MTEILAAAAGLSYLAALWQPLWWLANGRRRLTWWCPATIAVAATLTALTADHPLAVLNAVIWTWTAATRRHQDQAAARLERWSNEPLPRIGRQ